MTPLEIVLSVGCTLALVFYAVLSIACFSTALKADREDQS
jgi:hypothetical protein